MRLTRAFIISVHDLLMALIALPIALFLRMGDDFLTHFSSHFLTVLILSFALLAFLCFHFHRMYEGMWRYASLGDLKAIIKSVTFAVLLFLLFIFLVYRGEEFPRSALIILWLVLIVLLGAPRFIYRSLKDSSHKETSAATAQPKKIPALLIGSSHEADLFLRALEINKNALFKIVGIISLTKRDVGASLHGIKVMGTLQDLKPLVQKLQKKGIKPQKAILTNDIISQIDLQKILPQMEQLGLNLARLPKSDQIKAGLKEKTEIQPIAIEDLLQRPQRSLDRTQVKDFIKGTTVLVTGAGGSIGSELVRQISDYAPQTLILFENSEYNLYAIDMEIRNRHPKLHLIPLLADVRDEKRIETIFKTYQPDFVFHAAALKHVPMVECNPVEGLYTNAIGSSQIAQACDKFNVKAMVMVSTDKAVNPTNVMGASKRLAEMYTQNLDRKSKTNFVTVRFGNVLGSSGSVIPLFQKQIAAGGPITITHKDMTRYFMTIKEAVELILQAAALRLHHKDKDKGGLFVLEMGSPVKISDLAKQMIHLTGLKPFEDIDIQYIGLRPGEKLYEELFYKDEPLLKTPVEGLCLANPRMVEEKTLFSGIKELKKACIEKDPKKVLKLVKSLVKDYHPEKA